MVSLAVIDMGLTNDEEARAARLALKDVPLADLVEAARMVGAHPPEIMPNGHRRVYTTVDDRLVAAIYTGMHFDPTCASEAQSVVQLGGGLGVFVINNVPEVQG